MTQEEHIQQTVEKSITAFWDHEKRQSSSIAEFLYSQFLFIRKRWWILQFGCLLLLWLILNMGFSQVVERKAIAIIIPVFTVLILPELWRTRQCRMEEIENSSVYTTKDIYIARMVLFGIVDLFGLTLLWTLVCMQGIEHLIFELLIPFNGVCILMLASLTFYSGREFYLPISLTFIFTLAWFLLLSNEQLYAQISYSLWFGFFLFSLIVLLIISYQLIHRCEEVLVWN
ncbi:hypothetical protein H5996_08970 [Faecalicoccus pleomorphus]|uniref:hypothetical protein n=1 Tax=Faecalicoccus pleomorphus TaxID=1323 RepID=UPI00195FADA3|nr:hypothetical protein [Faecalicoccus pleomorphus]MBM6766027.1 hypothetical protein [Faecalicoccus pleomorphus]